MTPRISVVVPSHGRHLRLWWLLNALAEQSLGHADFEIIVVHDYEGPELLARLARHPLAAAGRLRYLRVTPGTGSPARQRNLGWREARAPLVAFTDDDCRPHPDWLRALDRAAGDPQAILQGTTRPDPLETGVFAAPHHRSLRVDPPDDLGQTCNIAYPRALLERAGGFDERLTAAAGEDTDLALRARGVGARLVGVPGALVFHAVEAFSLAAVIRLNFKWQQLPGVVRRHPQLRRRMLLRVFWRPSHLELPLAIVAAGGAGRRPALAGLALPYVSRALGLRGPGPRGRLLSAIELPGRVAVDLAEIGTLALGSARHRSLVL